MADDILDWGQYDPAANDGEGEDGWAEDTEAEDGRVGLRQAFGSVTSALRGLLNDDGTVGANVRNEKTDTGSLSVTHDGSPALTKEVVHRYEDGDGSTPFEMDVSGLPEHDDFVVVGKMAGTDYSDSGYKPVHLQVNGHTSAYRYNSLSQGSVTYTNGDSAWKETTFSARAWHPEWRLSGRVVGSGARSLSIRSQSMVEYQGNQILSGTIARDHPLTQISVFTEFTAIGKLTIVGVDY